MSEAGSGIVALDYQGLSYFNCYALRKNLIFLTTFKNASSHFMIQTQELTITAVLFNSWETKLPSNLLTNEAIS